MPKAKVTVVIPSYNRAKQLPRAIDSVRRQSYKKWKILIIDDCSTDNTMDVMKNEIKKGRHRITYLRLAKNKGLSHVMNEALKIVDTKYMIQLDSDDWLEERALKKLVKRMDQAPQTTALAHGNYYVWKSKDRRKLHKSRTFKSVDKYDLLCYGSSLYPRFYRTDCLRAVGGWPTDNKYGGRFMEDRQIMTRLIEKYDFLWLNKPLYNLQRYLEERATSTKNRDKYKELKKELITRTLKKWGGRYTPVFTTARNGWLRTKLTAKDNHST